jgi:hypothetical protein
MRRSKSERYRPLICWSGLGQGRDYEASEVAPLHLLRLQTQYPLVLPLPLRRPRMEARVQPQRARIRFLAWRLLGKDRPVALVTLLFIDINN